MRFVLFWICYGVFSSNAQIKTEVSYSKPLATFRFLEALSGHDSKMHEQTFDYLFIEEADVFSETIDVFNSINIDYTYVWEKYPDTRKKYRSTYDLLILALATSSTLDELPQKIFGIIPCKDAEYLVDCLEKITPYYDRYITASYKEKTQLEIQKYDGYRDQLHQLLPKMQLFYGTRWPKGLPFIISMYPIPGITGFTNASAHGNALVCNFLADYPSDYETRIGVMSDEAAHVFYDAQPIELQNSIEYWFMQNASKHKEVAYKYFGDGLAVSVGYGWLYGQLKGGIDQGLWSENTFIDRYGKALLPLVNQYIIEQKTIDSAFVSEAINVFEKEFPNSIYEYKPLFKTMTIFSNTEDQNKIKDISKMVKKHFNESEYEFITPLKATQTHTAMARMKGTQFYVVDGRYRSHMNVLKTHIPDLNEKLIKVRVPFKKNQYISFINSENNPILIALISDMKSFDKILHAIEKEQFINPELIFHSLED